MSNLTSDRIRVDQPPAADCEPLWTRRVGELCSDLRRKASSLNSAHELTAIAADLFVHNLEAVACGIWLLDRSTGCWQLSASAGALNRDDLRVVLKSIPSQQSGEGTYRARVAADIFQRWSAVANSGECAPSQSWTRGAAVIQRAGGDPLVVFVAWSDVLPEQRLSFAAEVVAREVSSGLETLRYFAGAHEMSRLGSAMFDCGPIAIVCVNSGWQCLRWNPAAERLFGWRTFDALHRPLECIPSDQRSAWTDACEKCVRDRLSVAERLVGQRRDGTPLDLNVRFIPLFDSARGGPDVLLLIEDETERASIEKYLRIELDVTAIISQSTSLETVRWQFLSIICRRMAWRSGEFWEVDDDGKNWRCTAAWDASQTAPSSEPEAGCGPRIPLDGGLPGLVRRQREVIWSSDVPLAERCNVPTPARSGGDDRFVAVPVTLGGEVDAVLVFYGIQAGTAGARLHDMIASVAEQVAQTLAQEQMRLTLQEKEDALRQTRKMEAIGRLAGGVAHDFNNLLSIILWNCESLQDEPAGESNVQSHVKEISTAADRAVQLTRQLLTFSRKRPNKPEVLDLRQVLREFDRMLQRVVGPQVIVETGVDPAVHNVRLDRVEFEQVMLNLAANARDAMPEGGRLTITSSNVSLGPRAVAAYADVKPGDYVKLCVSDTGCGMDKETCKRVFQPYFTTKDVGKGTGLGLATVYGIVRNARGFIRVGSAPGAGTRFTIFLPRSSEGIVPQEIDQQPPGDPRGTETILLVDDEDVLRNLLERILQVHGYTVHAAPNGPSALRFLEQPAGAVDLLLTDVVMPQMSGIQLAAEARKLRPEMPALFMSGFPHLADPSGSRIPHAPELLCKPFTSDVLARAVRRALDAVSVRA